MTPRLLPLLFCALLACALAPSGAVAAETLGVVDPVTDNYKASYNEDPSRPELRTWFSIHGVTAGGTTWAPARPQSIQVTSGGTVAVQSADGRSGTLVATTLRGPFGSPLIRVDPTAAESGGRWGVLATVTDRATLRSTPGVIGFTLRVGNATLATGGIEYRYDASLAGVAAGHTEYNGPGGRWFVGGIATRLNWESAAPPAQPNPPAADPGPGTTPTPTAPAARPRITSFVVPTRSCARIITVRVRGRAAAGARLTHARFSVAGGGFSGWVPVGAGYRLRLPATVGVHRVKVQLKDARGRATSVVTRSVRRACP